MNQQAQISAAVEALVEWAVLEVAVSCGAPLGLAEKQASLKVSILASRIRPETGNRRFTIPVTSTTRTARETEVAQMQHTWAASTAMTPADEIEAIEEPEAAPAKPMTNRQRYDLLFDLYYKNPSPAVRKARDRWETSLRLYQYAMAAKKDPNGIAK